MAVHTAMSLKPLMLTIGSQCSGPSQVAALKKARAWSTHGGALEGAGEIESAEGV